MAYKPEFSPPSVSNASTPEPEHKQFQQDSFYYSDGEDLHSGHGSTSYLNIGLEEDSEDNKHQKRLIDLQKEFEVLQSALCKFLEDNKHDEDILQSLCTIKADQDGSIKNSDKWDFLCPSLLEKLNTSCGSKLSSQLKQKSKHFLESYEMFCEEVQIEDLFDCKVYYDKLEMHGQIVKLKLGDNWRKKMYKDLVELQRKLMENQAVNLRVHSITSGSVLINFFVHGSQKINFKAVDDKMKEEFSIEDLYVVEESIHPPSKDGQIEFHLDLRNIWSLVENKSPDPIDLHVGNIRHSPGAKFKLYPCPSQKSVMGHKSIAVCAEIGSYQLHCDGSNFTVTAKVIVGDQDCESYSGDLVKDDESPLHYWYVLIPHNRVFAKEMESNDLLELQLTVAYRSPRSVMFHSAEERDQIPFHYHELLECDSSGLEYANADHEIKLSVPKSAVAAGETVYFEVGVTMYGPFTFPENTRHISPILWLCTLEKEGLMKPFQLSLRHILNINKTNENFHNVKFIKANHNIDGYTFKDCTDSQTILEKHGILTTKHCCLYCLQANITDKLSSDARYGLVRVEKALSASESEILFFAVYSLKTCMRAIQEQFPCENGYKLRACQQIQFIKRDKSIKVTVSVPFADKRSIVHALDPASGKIKESNFNIDSWRTKTPDEMRQSYPPRVRMTATVKDDTKPTVATFSVKFEGCANTDELNFQVNLPLKFDTASQNEAATAPTKSLRSQHEIYEPSVITLDSQPALVNLLSLTKSDGTRIRIINTLAPDWRCLAGYLAFDKDGAEIRIIVATHPHNPKACCQEVFQKWLQGRGIRPCTWAKLIEVLDDCEQANLADEIKKAVSGTVTSRHD